MPRETIGHAFCLYLTNNLNKNCGDELFSKSKVKRNYTMAKSIERILVVDDSERLIKTISRHLKREGFIMDSACSCEHARRKIEDSSRTGCSLDLVITDNFSPDRNGVEFLKWISDYHPQLSVIIISEFAQTIRLQSIMSKYMKGNTIKPMTPKELTTMIKYIDQNLRVISTRFNCEL